MYFKKSFNFPRCFIWGGGASSLLQTLKWADNKLKNKSGFEQISLKLFHLCFEKKSETVEGTKIFSQDVLALLQFIPEIIRLKKSSEVLSGKEHIISQRCGYTQSQVTQVTPCQGAVGGGRWEVGVAVFRCEELLMPTSRRPELSWAPPSEDHLSKMERHQVWRLVSLIAVCVGTHR